MEDYIGIKPAATRGEFFVAVVGESHYQDALETACGGRSEESASFECSVFLMPENDNQFDDQAVMIVVEGGGKVGYLTRPDARKYRARYGESVTWCPAHIVGGWDDGGSRGHFGINLDVDLR